MTQKLKTEILTAAIAGLESKKTRIDGQIREIRAMLSGEPATTAKPESAPATRKRFSPASRRRMAAAQKARWAKIKGESESPVLATPETPKPKRRISPEGMKRIIAATKKRWRLAKAAKAQGSNAAKKAPVKKPAKRTAQAPA
jgi:hypothetical protein